MKRCDWGKGMMMEYHDKEWGVPIHDDRKLFEFLVLESVQAGLSWEIVLRKRENFRETLHDFDPVKISRYTGKDVKRLLSNPGIIRNRLKIEAIISNAKRFLEVQREFGSFDRYIWQFTNHKTIKNRFKLLSQVPAQTKESDNMSRDLKIRGFKFVGPTVCYAHMQATGMVNDHMTGCFRYNQV